MKCCECGKSPAELEEYRELAADQPSFNSLDEITPDEYVRLFEGTYNAVSRQFCCTQCYIAIGMPTSPQGWKAP